MPFVGWSRALSTIHWPASSLGNLLLWGLRPGADLWGRSRGDPRIRSSSMRRPQQWLGSGPGRTML